MDTIIIGCDFYDSYAFHGAPFILKKNLYLIPILFFGGNQGTLALNIGGENKG